MVAASKNGGDPGVSKVRLVSSPLWRYRLRRRASPDALANITRRAFPDSSERTGDHAPESALRPQILPHRASPPPTPVNPFIRALTPTYSWTPIERQDDADKRAASRAAHDQVLCRQGTVEFISSLLKGTDTPDEPLPQLFDGLPDSVNEFAALADPTVPSITKQGSTSTLGPFIDNMITEQNRKAAAEAQKLGRANRFKMGPAPASALKRRTPAPPDFSAVPIDYPLESIAAKRARRINSAPARPGPAPWAGDSADHAHPMARRPDGFIDGPTPPTNRLPLGIAGDRASPVMMGGGGNGQNALSPSASSFGGVAMPAPAVKAEAGAGLAVKVDKPKAKNPKRADRRRTIARFTTAILRAGGSNAFIARDGLGYRKAFDRFLVETYGDTFAEGGYWYENARVEPFFRVLFHIATDGRVQLDPDAVNALFCKREKRQAAEWLLDEEELSKFGVTATQLAQIFEGPPSVSPTGYPRGTPLAIPTDAELDGGAVPAKMPASSSVAAVAAAAAAAAAVAQHQHHPQHSSHGDHHHRGEHYAPHPPHPHAMYGGGGGNGHHGHHGQYGGAGMGGGDAHGYHGSIPVAHTVNHHGGHPGSGYPHNLYGGVGVDGIGAMHGQTFPPMHAMHHGFGGGPYAHPSQHPHELAGSGRHGHAGLNAQQVEMAGSGPRRQYSSDLSRLMSEFNANPSSSEDFLKSFLQRTASELDNLAQLGSK